MYRGASPFSVGKQLGQSRNKEKQTTAQETAIKENLYILALDV